MASDPLISLDALAPSLLPLHRLKLSKDVLGSGGFARVVRAQLDGTAVAVKVLLPRWCDPADGKCNAYRDLFFREGLLLQKLEHKNIIKCHGFVMLPANHPGMPTGAGSYQHPAPAMVLELCLGGSLSNQIYKEMASAFGKGYSDLAALDWMLDIAQALQHLHALPTPVVHRDVKLDNMLLQKVEGGSRMVAKLADFGLHVSLSSQGGNGKRPPVLRSRSYSVRRGTAFAATASPDPAAGPATTPTPIAPTPCDVDGGAELRDGAPGKPPPPPLRPVSVQSSSSGDDFHGVSALDQSGALAVLDPRAPAAPARSGAAATPARPSGGDSHGLRAVQLPPLPPPASEQVARPSRLRSGAMAGGEAAAFAVAAPADSSVRGSTRSVTGGHRPLARSSSVSDFIQRSMSSRTQDFEMAFHMTGATGSPMYMSPEVQRSEPYNEKADVYSFGVMLYEVFARSAMKIMITNPGAYLARVADGHRPPRPDRMDPEVFQLVDWCWKGDPVDRPQMSEVVQCLLTLKSEMEAAAAAAGTDTETKAAAQPTCCIIS